MSLKQTFVVYDDKGAPCHCDVTAQLCHEHINDAIESEIEGASKWVVREVTPIVTSDELSGSSGQARRVNTRLPAPGDGASSRRLRGWVTFHPKSDPSIVWNAALRWFDEEEMYALMRNGPMQAHCRDRTFELLVLVHVLEDEL